MDKRGALCSAQADALHLAKRTACLLSVCIFVASVYSVDGAGVSVDISGAFKELLNVACVVTEEAVGQSRFCAW